MSEETTTETKGPKVVRFFLGGPATITAKDADGEERQVTNPDFRFYHGVPARDLTEEEYEALAPELKAAIDDGHVTGTRDAGRKKGGEPVLEETREKLYARTKPAARKE